VDLSAAHPRMLICDAVFNPAETRLIAMARQQGLLVLDGLAILVYQGAIGFELSTHERVPEQVMRQGAARGVTLTLPGP
jgi:shikimate 5-dehydrogenase